MFIEKSASAFQFSSFIARRFFLATGAAQVHHWLSTVFVYLDL
jgi:hypothetical protein